MMEEKLKQLELEAAEKVEAAGSLKEVNDIRVQYLGKRADYRSSPRHGQTVRRRAPENGSARQ